MQFTYHYDHPNQQWNVFEILDGHEIYICSFKSVAEAIVYCNEKSYPSGSGSLFSCAAREVNHAG